MILAGNAIMHICISSWQVCFCQLKACPSIPFKDREEWTSDLNKFCVGFRREGGVGFKVGPQLGKGEAVDSDGAVCWAKSDCMGVAHADASHRPAGALDLQWCCHSSSVLHTTVRWQYIWRYSTRPGRMCLHASGWSSGPGWLPTGYCKSGLVLLQW